VITRCAVLVAATCVAISSVAIADDPSADELVGEALVAKQELAFDEALVLLERAWHRGGSRPAQIRRIFALSGQFAGDIGDYDAARLWFSRWLCVEPDAALPAGASPKVTAAFAEAQRGLGGASITARARIRGDGIEFVLERDPLSLVTRVRAGDGTIAVEQNTRVELPIVEAVELLDRDGNVLLTIQATREVVPPPPPRPSWYARWPTWAGATAGFAVIAGASFGVSLHARSQWRELNATSGQHEASEALALEQRFDRGLWISRFALGGAIVTGVIGSVLFARRHEQQVTVTTTTGGGAVSWSTAF